MILDVAVHAAEPILNDLKTERKTNEGLSGLRQWEYGSVSAVP